VPVYEAGEDGAVCYIASAYCPGITLAAWLKERARPVPCRAAAALVATLAEAVAHAHQRGVLHRDLKPSNVIVQKTEDRSQKSESSNASASDFCLLTSDFSPKITDFGLAKLMGEAFERSVHACQTQTGAILGTPGYMAPEQAAGNPRAIGATADVYSLGTILYEMIAGRPPFRGDNALETLRQVQSDEPRPLSRLQAKVPLDLQTIRCKCLQKEPSRRHASAAALAEDLRRFLAGEPIVARPVSAWERARRWARRWARRRPAVVALLGGVLWHTLRLERAVKTADALRIEAQREREESLRQQRLVEEREQLVRRYLYVANVKMAHHFWNHADVQPMRELLARYQAEPGEADARDFTWHYLWRLCHGERLVLRGPASDVYCVAFSPDGKTLAGSSRDGTITLWDAASGLAQKVLRGHGGEVNTIAFSPDGKTLASASDDTSVKLWELASGRDQTTL
jgi:eukaryotic-like serine/threonine-protein kinase